MSDLLAIVLIGVLTVAGNTVLHFYIINRIIVIFPVFIRNGWSVGKVCVLENFIATTLLSTLISVLVPTAAPVGYVIVTGMTIGIAHAAVCELWGVRIKRCEAHLRWLRDGQPLRFRRTRNGQVVYDADVVFHCLDHGQARVLVGGNRRVQSQFHTYVDEPISVSLFELYYN